MRTIPSTFLRGPGLFAPVVLSPGLARAAESRPRPAFLLVPPQQLSRFLELSPAFGGSAATGAGTEVRLDVRGRR